MRLIRISLLYMVLMNAVLSLGCDPLLGVRIDVKTPKKAVEKDCALSALNSLAGNGEWKYQSIPKRNTFSLIKGRKENNAFESYMLKHQGGTRIVRVELLKNGGQSIEVSDGRIGETFNHGEIEAKKNALNAIYSALVNSCPGMPPLDAAKQTCYSVSDCE